MNSQEKTTFEQRLCSTSLTPLQHRIAKVVLDEPERIAMSTISGIADELQVNQSTVTRFCNAIGLDGFMQLKNVCKERIRQNGGMLQRFIRERSDREKTTGLEFPRNITAAKDQSSIASTFAGVDPHNWDVIVSDLAQAPHLGIIGLRQSAPAASLLAYLLGLIRDSIVRISSPQAPVDIDALRQLEDGDCLFAISTYPCTRATVETARWAQSNGITVIALTDGGAHTLIEHSDRQILSFTESDSVLSSVTALVAVVQALAADVATYNPERTQQLLEREEKLLTDFDVYAK